VIVALVLAAGRSARFGSPKMLAAVGEGGETVIHRTVSRIMAAHLDQVLVVAGDEMDRIGRALAGLHAHLAVNAQPAEGFASSLCAGLRSLPSATKAVVVLLGAEIDVEASVVDRVVAAWRAGMGRIIQARYRGTPGHPVLFDAAFFPEMLLLEGDKGARDVIASHMNDVAYVDVDEPAPRDIDTPDDLRAARP